MADDFEAALERVSIGNGLPLGNRSDEQSNDGDDQASPPPPTISRRRTPIRNPLTSSFTTLTRSIGALKSSVIGAVSTRNSGDYSRRNSDDNSCNGTTRSDGGARDDLDLYACISAIEGIRGVGGLTPEQDAAVRHLRSTVLSPGGSPRGSPRGHKRSKTTLRSNSYRRKAIFYSRYESTPLLTNELLKCFHEVEDNVEDTDQMEAATAVLATYGGQVFKSAVSNLIPSSEHPSHSCEDSRRQSSLDLDDAIGLDLDDIGDSQKSQGSSANTDESQKSDRRTSSRRSAAVGIDPLRDSDMEKLYVSDHTTSKNYCPPEWNALTSDARTELSRLLSWENLSKWEFNIRDVAHLSRGVLRSPSGSLHGMEGQFCPLLLVGWAILCAPMAQQAMEGSLGDNFEREESPVASHPYHFVRDLSLDPEAICNFLREIESMYRPELPYHNNVHAADVTQTLHCLLQFMGPDNLENLFDPVEIFSTLLAATFHDVDHRGTNNLFHKNAKSSLAIRYNDASILENMHSAVGHSFLMGEEKQEEWDVFKRWSEGQKDQARSVMIRSVLGTDMSKHFESVGELASLVDKIRANDMEDETRNEPRPILSILNEVLSPRRISVSSNSEASNRKECSKFTDYILKFLLHAADISNPTKSNDLAVHWADKALAEFFAQGDRETELGLPVSPLCDRHSVQRADSQIGFLKFVIRPTFVLLGEILPRVKEEILPTIDENLNYWTRVKSIQLNGLVNAASKLKVASSASRERLRRRTEEESSGESADRVERSPTCVRAKVAVLVEKKSTIDEENIGCSVESGKMAADNVVGK